MTTILNEPIVNSPSLYVNGLGFLQQDSNTTLNIQGGNCRDSTDTVDISIPLGTYTINAAINGLNGLDTGSLTTSSPYAVYAISSITGNPLYPSGFLVSINFTAPLMPFGYSNFRRIGIAYTDNSSHLLPMMTDNGNSNNRYVQLGFVSVLLSAGNATTTANITNPLCPGGSIPTYYYSFTPATAGNAAAIGAQNVAAGIISLVGNVVSKASTGTFVMGTAALNYSVTNGSDALTIQIVGFWDLL